MVETVGWLKLHRKLNEWEWIDDPNTFCLFIHCLLIANRKPSKYRGHDIPVGGFVTSYDSLSSRSGLSVQQVRTALKKLIKSQVVTSKATSNFSIISILKWDSYQDDQQADNKQPTNKQQTPNKQPTTEEEDNNILIKEDKNYTGEFEQFWQEWKPYDMPKGNKKIAKQKYDAARKRVSLEVIEKGRDEYIRYCHQTLCKTQHLSTWLNNRGWEFEKPEFNTKGNSTNDELAQFLARR